MGTGSRAKSGRDERPSAQAAPDLSDPCVTVMVVEHRDRLGCFGTEQLDAALGAAGRGRRIVMAEPGERSDDLVRDMIGVLS
jgi:putative resolvase